MNYVKLRISGRRRLPYYLTLKYKYTIIRGKSGTGKSELVRIVSRDETSINSNPQNLQVVAPRLLSRMSKQQILNLLNGYMMNPFDTVFIFDEDTPIISSGKFQEAIQEVDAFFILICRHELGSLPYGIQQIYELFSDGQMVSLAPMYDELLKNKFSQFESVKQLYTEDSNSGYKFLAKRSENVYSSKGKDKILKLLPKVSNTAFLVDYVGFGSVIQRALDALGSNKLVFIPSFEGAVLKAITESSAFGISNLTVNLDILHASNLEVMLEDTLKKILAEQQLYMVDGSLRTISYTKEALLPCLASSCGMHSFCSKSNRYNSCYLHLDWMYLMYPECICKFVERNLRPDAEIRLRISSSSNEIYESKDHYFGN